MRIENFSPNNDKIVRKEESSKVEAIRAKGIKQNHEHFIESATDFIKTVLEKQDSFSETVALRPDGSLNPESTADLSRSVLINSVETLELTYNGLMKACKDISDANPELQFSFKTDPAGKSITYTVTQRL
ncbi:MAG: hypothetical protein Q7R65_03055 [bacterium]|nr:hypothetical protein [bacterium]